MPSLGIFAEDVLYDTEGSIYGNFAEVNGYRLEPGIYVYDWKSNETINVLLKDGSTKFEVKPYTIYYIKSLPNEDTNE